LFRYCASVASAKKRQRHHGYDVERREGATNLDCPTMPRILRRADDIPRRSRRGTLKTQDDFLAALEEGVATALGADGDDTSVHFSSEKPTVILVIGVNGAGKTTFIGKLCALMAARGKRAL